MYGLGTVSRDEATFAEQYQSRISDPKASNEAIYEDLALGKMYRADTDTVLEAVNEVLDFWFLPLIDGDAEVAQYSSIAEAIEALAQSGQDYIIFLG